MGVPIDYWFIPPLSQGLADRKMKKCYGFLSIIMAFIEGVAAGEHYYLLSGNVGVH